MNQIDKGDNTKITQEFHSVNGGVTNKGTDLYGGTSNNNIHLHVNIDSVKNTLPENKPNICVKLAKKLLELEKILPNKRISQINNWNDNGQLEQDVYCGLMTYTTEKREIIASDDREIGKAEKNKEIKTAENLKQLKHLYEEKDIEGLINFYNSIVNKGKKSSDSLYETKTKVIVSLNLGCKFASFCLWEFAIESFEIAEKFSSELEDKYLQVESWRKLVDLFGSTNYLKSRQKYIDLLLNYYQEQDDLYNLYRTWLVDGIRKHLSKIKESELESQICEIVTAFKLNHNYFDASIASMFYATHHKNLKNIKSFEDNIHKAKDFIRKIKNDKMKRIAEIKLYRSIINLSDPKSDLDLYKNYLNQLEKRVVAGLDELEKTDYYLFMAESYFYVDELDDCKRLIEKSIKISERYHDQYTKAKCYQYLGYLFYHLEDERYLEYTQKSLSIFKSYINESPEGVIECYRNLAKFTKDDKDLSLTYLDLAVGHMKEAYSYCRSDVIRAINEVSVNYKDDTTILDKYAKKLNIPVEDFMGNDNNSIENNYFELISSPSNLSLN